MVNDSVIDDDHEGIRRNDAFHGGAGFADRRVQIARPEVRAHDSAEVKAQESKAEKQRPQRERCPSPGSDVLPDNSAIEHWRGCRTKIQGGNRHKRELIVVVVQVPSSRDQNERRDGEEPQIGNDPPVIASPEEQPAADTLAERRSEESLRGILR